MNPEVKAKWLEALRSDRYQQTHGVLKNDNGYCCLGVLCDVVKEQVEMDWHRDPEDGKIYFGKDAVSGIAGYPPIPVTQLAGVTDKMVKIDGVAKTLVNHNDSRNVSFKQIADAIEEQL